MFDDDNETLEGIERKSREDPYFTVVEREMLREIIRVYRGWAFFVKVLKGGVVVLGVIAAGVASYRAVISEVKRWLIG